MSEGLRLHWDDAVLGYDFGPGHPMDPARLELTIELVRAFGLDRLPGVRTVSSPPAADAALRLVHTEDYVAAVRRAAATGEPDLARGLGTEDNPVFPAIHDASALIAGQSVAAAEEVWREGGHSVNFTGGLHHAMPDAASGFCVYNDAALAVARLLELGAERVAYVDTDAHHGDGVERAFWNDPRVLTLSVHETPRTLFPWSSGWAQEVGGPDALGGAVNVAVPPGTGDAGWLRAFHAVVPPLVRAFRPQVLVSQHGADSHAEDPQTHLALTVDAQREAALTCAAMAAEAAGGRWVALGGGGYAVADVVPRVWTHLTAIAAGHPLDPLTPTPTEWRAHVVALTRRMPPRRMTDGRTPQWADFEDGYDPADRVDQAILATRQAVFPLHGILP